MKNDYNKTYLFNFIIPIIWTSIFVDSSSELLFTWGWGTNRALDRLADGLNDWSRGSVSCDWLGPNDLCDGSCGCDSISALTLRICFFPLYI